jgi:hypothetical protein
MPQGTAEKGAGGTSRLQSLQRKQKAKTFHQMRSAAPTKGHTPGTGSASCALYGLKCPYDTTRA